MLIVQVCDFGTTGDARYRALDPSRHLARLPGATVVDCYYLSRHLLDLADAADLLLLHFVNDWDFLDLLMRRRAAGKITVFEANDYYPDIQPWNPHARSWEDGTLRQLLQKFLTLADAVQTSTDALAERWKRLGARQVAVFPNHLVQVPPLAPRPDRPLTIGWGGSAGHLADWYDVAPTLQTWLDAHPDVHLAVMSMDAARPFFRLPENRYHFTPFGSLEQYQSFLGRLDVGIAPLLPTEFNRCRSDVKFLEYAAHGAAGIYADLDPYQTVRHGQTGLLYRTHDQLIEHLETLRTNPAVRQALRQSAHNYAYHERMLRDHVATRLAWYEQLLADRPRTTTRPVTPDTRQADANHFQVLDGEPEYTLIAALRQSNADEAGKIFSSLVARFPTYLPAVQYFGLHLNNQRQYRAALSALETLTQRGIEGARLWSEAGRALFHLGEHARAREAMERAIRFDPHHLLAWQYYLRLLAATSSPDAPALARRAREIFPDCLPVALLAITTVPPQDAPPALLDVIESLLPRTSSIEKPFAMTATRSAVLRAVQAAPMAPETLRLLGRAGEFFAGSTRLAAELGASLFRHGDSEGSLTQFARAMQLHRQAATFRDEFPADQPPPVEWQLSDHIQSTPGAKM